MDETGDQISSVGHLVQQAWDFMTHLETSPEDGNTRRLAFRAKVREIGEIVDDQPAKLLPPGIREAYLGAVDNPIADGIEDTYLWGPLADTLYNLLKLFTHDIQQGLRSVTDAINAVIARVMSWLNIPLPA
jgi:hypothetical protein